MTDHRPFRDRMREKIYPRPIVFWVRVLSRLGFFAAGLVILYLSLRPGISVGVSDKFVHFAVYAVWTFVSLIGVRRWRYGVLVAVLIALAGAAIEVIQPFFGRHGDVLDFVANTAGVIIGSLATLIGRVTLRTAATVIHDRDGSGPA